MVKKGKSKPGKSKKSKAKDSVSRIARGRRHLSLPFDFVPSPFLRVGSSSRIIIPGLPFLTANSDRYAQYPYSLSTLWRVCLPGRFVVPQTVPLGPRSDESDLGPDPQVDTAITACAPRLRGQRSCPRRR